MSDKEIETAQNLQNKYRDAKVVDNIPYTFDVTANLINLVLKRDQQNREIAEMQNKIKNLNNNKITCMNQLIEFDRSIIKIDEQIYKNQNKLNSLENKKNELKKLLDQ